MSKQRQSLLPGMDNVPLTAAPRPRISPPPPMEHPPAPTSEQHEDANAAGTFSLVGKTVWVVDSNSLIFQVFHAIPEMTNPTGEPVNAVFGFTRDMLFLLEEKKPDYLFCALDEKGPTFRHALSDTYKAGRSEMPEDLGSQFPWIMRMLAAFRIPTLGCPTFEADDVLATLARLTEELGGECYLVSGDKDCRQLLSQRVKVYNVRKNQIYDAASLHADWGIRPEQVVDYQAIVGDSVDNVRGIAGIGPKGASQLLSTYQTLEGIFEHVNEISGVKRKQSLVEGREQALLGRRLVQLDGYVPIEIDWEAAHRGPFDKNEIIELFQELGFHGFSAKVRAMQLPAELEAARPPEDWQATYHTVDTPEALAALAAELSRQSQFSFCTQTTHAWPTWADIVGLSFAWKEGEAWYVPVCGPAGEQCLDRSAVLEALRPTLENPRIKKLGQNLKSDLIVLKSAGIGVQGVAFDTMIASYLLDAGERNHSLDELSLRYLNHATITMGSLLGAGRDRRSRDEVAIARVAEYAGESVDVALRLTPLLQRKLQGAELDRLNKTLELPLIDVLMEMESTGIRVNTARLAELSEQFGRQLQLVETQIFDMAGRPINIGSPKQLQELLFTQLKLPVVKRTKNGPSTDVDVLEELASVHPLPAKIIEYRHFAKLKNTYVDALPAMINPRTGRVHASFNQVVAATGRLSSHDPNLQNIPIRTEEGRAIRSAFLPEEGWLLLAADYSQIELRVLAHFCQDPTLLEAFARDEDIHARVASEVHGVPLDGVTSEMRRQAKAVNFGIIYGQSAFGLARQLGIDQKEAEKFIEAYFARYGSVEKFLNGVLAECQANGYVSTILGRRRSIQGIRSGVRRQRNPPERTAINTVIQGSAADLIKAAMLAVHRRLKQERLSARLLLQIHDELVLETPPDEAEHLTRLVTEEMSQVLELRAPIKVDVKTGRTWAEV